MIAVWIGFILILAVFAFSIAGAYKAQLAIKMSKHQSMISYGVTTQLIQDKNDLHRFGLAQQLRRRFGGFSAFGLSFNAMALIGSAALLFGPALSQGGPSVMGIGFPLLALFTLAVSASLAELTSAVPTAGGMYHAAAALGGRKWGWRTGWFQAAGHLAMLTLLNSVCAAWMDSFASARFHYDQSTLSFFGILAALTVAQAAMNHWGASWLSLLQSSGVWIQIVTAIIVLSGLIWMFWPGQYSPVLLFQFQNGEMAGTVQIGSFVGGTLLLLKLFTGMDGAANGAEETLDPRIRVPWAIYLSTTYTFVLGFVLLMFMTLTMTFPINSNGELGSYLQRAVEGWGGSFFVEWLVIGSLWSSGLQTMTVCSRTVFSLARDEALPLSRRWSLLSERYQIPVQALWLCAAVAITMSVLVQLIEAGNGEIMLLLSIGIICLQTAYAIPIGLKLKYGRTHPLLLHAPWKLSNWSIPVNWMALVWLMVSAALAAGFIHRSGAIAAALLLLCSTVIEFRYEKRHLLSLESRVKRTRKEISLMERKFPLN